VPKKTKVVQDENEEPLEPSALSAEAKAGKVTPRRPPKSRKSDKPARKKSATARKTKMPQEQTGMRTARAIGRRNSSPRLLHFGAPASIWFTRRRQFRLARSQTTAPLRVWAAVVFVRLRCGVDTTSSGVLSASHFCRYSSSGRRSPLQQAVNASRMRRRSAAPSSTIKICFDGFSLSRAGLLQTTERFKF
jgi:hypothetical protein